MKNLINWLETSFSPKMNKINHNIWVVTLKDSIMQILPFILLGSVFCVGAVIENWITLPFTFWTPFGWTMGMVSVLVALLIPFNFCEKKRLKKQRLIAGCTGLILFFIAITPEIVKEGELGFSSSAFGAGGMFCAMATGVITCIVFNMFGKFSFFKEDNAIPDFVRQWFDALLPIGIVIFGGFILIQVMEINLYEIVTGLFMPLKGILNTWYGFILSGFIVCFIYSMGISSWVLTPVTQPIKLNSIAANLAMVTAGTATATNMNMYTETLMFTCYMWIGGIACTFPLVILLAKSKSKKLSALGKACVGPAIFNINEPVVFGCIAWNPMMMLPMWIIGIVIPAITWFGCKVLAFAPIPKIQFELWYCPYPISTWISSQGSIGAILLVAITFIVSGLIWYPFFRAYEKQCIDEEIIAKSKN
ncbi:MAG: PTS sugar transporter subunit IIC [Breznakia sp.]